MASRVLVTPRALLLCLSATLQGGQVEQVDQCIIPILILLLSPYAQQWKMHTADTKCSMQGHTNHVATAITYLRDHPCQQGRSTVVTLCVSTTSSHTSDKALRKVISLCGTPCLTTQHISTCVQEESMHYAGSHLLRHALNDTTSSPPKLLVCVPAHEDCQDLLDPRCTHCHATVKNKDWKYLESMLY